MNTKLSMILINLIKESPPEELCIQKSLDVLRERAVCFIILLIAFLNTTLPLEGIPGAILLSGGLMALLSLYIVFQPTIRLPQKIGNMSVSEKKWRPFLEKAVLFADTIEDYIHPRWDFWSKSIVERFFGVLIFVLGICMTMDLPMGTFIPSFAIVFISIGLIMKDGLQLCIGGFIAIFIYTLLLTAYLTLLYWLFEIFDF